MRFELMPTIDIMYELYQQPRNLDRFKQYLNLLHGDSNGELIIPLGGFNPMAKAHILKKLGELKVAGAEEIMQEVFDRVNKEITGSKHDNTFKVALALSDDIGGAWTNRYTSDYDSKFRIQALVRRNFCTPVFWSGEIYNRQMIEERTLEYIYRTIWFLDHPKPPSTLRDHIAQEMFVAKSLVHPKAPSGIDYITLDSFYRDHQRTTQYPMIFNFFYGDKASGDLEFVQYGIEGYMPGFAYCRKMATIR